MEYLIIIISLISKEIYTIPYITYSFIYVTVLTIVIILMKNKLNNPFYSISSNGYMFFLLLVIGQYLALVVASGEMGISIWKQFIKFLFFVIICACYYFYIIQLMDSDSSIIILTKGFFGAFVVIELICFFQLLYIYASTAVSPILLFIGQHFEVQDIWDPELYLRGTFTMSNLRVNGLSREPGYLAAMLAITFAPFILAAIKNKKNIFFKDKKYSEEFYYSLLAVLIVTLLLAKTSTGLIAIIVILTVPIFISGKHSKIRWIITLIPFALIGLGMYLYIPVVNEMLNHYIFDKGSTVSLPMRLGAFEATKETIIKHWIIGVGYDNTSYYNLNYFPAIYRNVSEYKMHVANNYFSDLSSLGGIVAQYGIIISLMLVVYFVKLVKDIKRYAVILRDDFYIALSDSATFFFLCICLISIFAIDIKQPIYFITIFYFIGLRKFLLRKIKLQEVSDEKIY